MFLIGSLATTLGVLISWKVLSPEIILGEDGKIIAGMLTGTYTGGSVNFNAIALEYGFQEKGILYAGTIAVDNVITALWIIATLTFPMSIGRLWKAKANFKSNVKINDKALNENEGIDLTSMMWLIFLGVAAYFISEMLSGLLPNIPSILILSTIGILLAQTKFVANLKGSHNLGLYLVYIFLAVIGAYCELSAVAELKDVGINILLFAGLE